MTEQTHLPLFHLYVDDSGTRHPDKTRPTSSSGDWFGLGGFLIAEEDIPAALAAHQSFCEKWRIKDYPLHSVKIRHKKDTFAWLAQLPQHEMREFFSDLEKLMLGIPIIAHACVVDRPGYHARYYEKYGKERWHLCKTAFTIMSERAAKFAARKDRRVRVFVEETDRKSDQKIKDYFRDMRGTGMPFNSENSHKYGPMNPEELRFRLIELRFKTKKSPMMQLADLILYPLCRAPYDSLYRPMKALRETGLLLDSHLSKEEHPHLGIKLSCFDK